MAKIYKSTHSGNLLIIQGKEKANHTKAHYNQSTKKTVVKRKFLKLVSGKGALYIHGVYKGTKARWKTSLP